MMRQKKAICFAGIFQFSFNFLTHNTQTREKEIENQSASDVPVEQHFEEPPPDCGTTKYNKPTANRGVTTYYNTCNGE